MKSRAEIKELAKNAFRVQRGTAILLGFVFGSLLCAWAVIISAVAPLLGEYTPGVDGEPGTYVVPITDLSGALYWLTYLAGMFLLYVMMINLFGEYIKIYKREKASISALFTEFAVNFWRKLGGMLWMSLWLMIWTLPLMVSVVLLTLLSERTLLLTVPATMTIISIKALAYCFTYNILADCPNATATQALKISIRITKGYKGHIFVFFLSWIGWTLLSVLTFGVLYIVFVGPYYYTAYAGLYLELRDEALREGKITLEELGMAETGIPKRYDPEIFLR
jgi:uncharacterized membrane protein